MKTEKYNEDLLELNEPVLIRPCVHELSDAMRQLRQFDTVEEFETFLDEFDYYEIEEYGDGDGRIGWPNSYLISSGEYSPEYFMTSGITKEESLRVYNEWKGR